MTVTYQVSFLVVLVTSLQSLRHANSYAEVSNQVQGDKDGSSWHSEMMASDSHLQDQAKDGCLMLRSLVSCHICIIRVCVCVLRMDALTVGEEATTLSSRSSEGDHLQDLAWGCKWHKRCI